jgi:DNA-binding winged helix-turn-helix (wHTH) protein
VLLFEERAGDLLSHDDLMQTLWPGVVVEENSPSQAIWGLRRVLGDQARGGRYIQTLARRGFRLVATLTELSEPDADTASLEGMPSLAPGASQAAPKRKALPVLALSQWWWMAEERPRRPEIYAAARL